MLTSWVWSLNPSVLCYFMLNVVLIHSAACMEISRHWRRCSPKGNHLWAPVTPGAQYWILHDSHIAHNSHIICNLQMEAATHHGTSDETQQWHWKETRWIKSTLLLRSSPGSPHTLASPVWVREAKWFHPAVITCDILSCDVFPLWFHGFQRLETCAETLNIKAASHEARPTAAAHFHQSQSKNSMFSPQVVWSLQVSNSFLPSLGVITGDTSPTAGE